MYQISNRHAEIIGTLGILVSIIVIGIADIVGDGKLCNECIIALVIVSIFTLIVTTKFFLRTKRKQHKKCKYANTIMPNTTRKPA